MTLSLIDFVEPEKWKIITESGIIDQVNASDKRKRRQKQIQEESNRDYIFEGIFFSIPTTCLFVVMDVLVHRQFGETYGGSDIFHKVIKIFPGNHLECLSSVTHTCLPIVTDQCCLIKKWKCLLIILLS